MSQQQNTALCQEIYSLSEGYAVRSGCTNMPYIKCSEETVNDQVFLFRRQEDAQAFCEAHQQEAGPLSVLALRTLPLPEQQGRAVNGVRRFLAALPTLDVDVVCYQGEGMAQGRECYVSDILPQGFAQKLMGARMYNPLLQLTGIFFCQAARLPREKQDPQELRQAEEEFSANLVKSSLFLAVLPPENQQEEQPGLAKVQLSQCRFPFVKNKKGEVFMPIFTDIAELQKYAGSRPMAAMRVGFTKLHHYFLKEAKSYLLNPAGFALPLRREQLAPLAARFGLRLEELEKAPGPAQPAQG